MYDHVSRYEVLLAAHEADLSANRVQRDSVSVSMHSCIEESILKPCRFLEGLQAF